MWLARTGIMASSSSMDIDALAFITAANITDNTQKSAVNQLVKDLKSANIWTKMKAIYPFVGGTATTHKWNLKDPRDLDVAYRLSFIGGGTHSATGYLPNGTTAYANTFLTPSLSLGINSAHLSYYSRTSTTSDSNNYVIGADNFNGFSAIILRNNVKYFRFTNISTAYEDAGYNGALSTSGFFVGTQDANNVKLFRNNTNIAQNTGTDSRPIVDAEVYIGCTNSYSLPQAYTTAESAFASIGNGLTDTESANFYTAVQAYQTTLNRQI